MSFQKTFVVAGLAVCAFAGPAAVECEWNPNGSGNWSSATRWKNGVVLTGEATDIAVTINGCTGTVTEADAALFAKASTITLTGAASCLVVENSSAQDLSCPAKFMGDGAFLKLGNGACWLTFQPVKTTGNAKGFDITGGWGVRGGLLAFPRGVTVEPELQKVSVWAPGVVLFPGGASSHLAQGLWGDGIVSNDVSNTIRLEGGTLDHPAVFSGDIVNHGYVTPYGKGVQYLTGTNSTAGKDLLVFGSGLVGVRRFGATDNPNGSWGTVNVQFRGSATVLYLGDGERTTKNFTFGAGASKGVIDGGEHGGLVLRGNLSVSTENLKMHLLYLKGNGGTNEVNAAVGSAWKPSGAPAITPHVIKQGPGTWAFTYATMKNLRGGFSVEEGTLLFTSIAEAGADCALGDATILHSPYCGVRDDEKAVPYAFLLGDGGTDVSSPTLATMAYEGAVPGFVSTRPIALKGAGRLKSDTSSISWAGITASDKNEHTLVLGGATGGSVASCVTNGPGTVSVVKDGAGTWTISGDYDVKGGVAANEGRLRLAGTDCEWYRLSIIENWWAATNALGNPVDPDGDASRCVIRQFALFDDDGNNQILNLAHNTAADGKPALLAPGEAAMGTDRYTVLGSTPEKRAEYALTNLFTESTATCFSALNNRPNSDETWSIGGANYNPADESHWVRVVMRLPVGAKPVTHYDIRAVGSYPGTGSATLRLPRSWRLEGSADGVNWRILDEVISNGYDRIVTGGGNHWFSNNKTTSGGGYGPIAATMPAARRPTSLAAVSAAEGATLESVGALTADGIAYDGEKGGGTISGFTFSSDATLRLTNCEMPKTGSLHLPISIVNSSGFANREWSVVLDGQVRHGLYAVVREDGIDVFRRGLVLIVR